MARPQRAMIAALLALRRFSTAPLRAPIVTVMGHVDHGKTTMLDYLRSSSLAAQEAGGITQHIGAFQVPVKGSVITFLDTPGHAAFSAMRQRGVTVTDIIVLVVAVEDGVMPQTEEVISLASSTSTPLIVAMNKWDKILAAGLDERAPSVRKLKEALLRKGIQLEEHGGSVQCIPVSAKTGYNMDLLAEAIVAEAEIQELRADPDTPAVAAVIEAKSLTGLGPCATCIVQAGTIRPGMFLASKSTYAKVRSLLACGSKHPLKSAGPSVPVDIVGWKEEAPAVGSTLHFMESELQCKDWLEGIQRKQQLADMKAGEHTARKRGALDRELLKMRRERSKDLSLKPIRTHSYEQLSKGNGLPVLDVVLHTDVVGSSEALKTAIAALPQKRVKVNIIDSRIGAPTESSIDLLRASSAGCLVAFNTPIPRAIGQLLEPEQIVTNNVIYHLLDQLKAAMVALLPPECSEEVLGTGSILQVFNTGKGLTIAGCRVDDGIITKKASEEPEPALSRAPSKPTILVGIERSGRRVWSGPIKGLRHLKNEIPQAQKGLECGIALEDIDEACLQVGDQVKCIQRTFRPASL